MFFDHCNNYISQDSNFSDFLEDKGFTIATELDIEHSEETFCRFIRLRPPCESKNYPKDRFLEYCFKKDFHTQIAGFSTASASSLDDYFSKIKNRFPENGIQLTHKNYEWQEINKRLPGWNFIMFQRNIYNAINIWVTEFEDRPNLFTPGTRLHNFMPHPNTCEKIHAILLRKHTQLDITKLELLFDTRFQNNCLTLEDGIKIVLVSADELPKVFSKKTHSFVSVILSCTDIKKFKSHAGKNTITFNGENFFHIEQPTHCWDILVQEEVICQKIGGSSSYVV